MSTLVGFLSNSRSKPLGGSRPRCVLDQSPVWRPSEVGDGHKRQNHQRQSPCSHAISRQVAGDGRHYQSERHAGVRPFLQQSKPWHQQHDRGYWFRNSENYPEVLWVAGLGKSGDDLLTPGQVRQGTEQRQAGERCGGPVCNLSSHESSLSGGVQDPHRNHRISSILCTAPSGRVSPTPTVTMRFKNAYASAEVSNLGTVRK